MTAHWRVDPTSVSLEFAGLICEAEVAGDVTAINLAWIAMHEQEFLPTNNGGENVARETPVEPMIPPAVGIRRGASFATAMYARREAIRSEIERKRE